jgi:hypothetical protein
VQHSVLHHTLGYMGTLLTLQQRSFTSMASVRWTNGLMTIYSFTSNVNTSSVTTTVDHHGTVRSAHLNYTRSAVEFGTKAVPSQTTLMKNSMRTVHTQSIYWVHHHRSNRDSLFTYSFEDIDQISLMLGIPWETSKDQPFGRSTTYIGFVWDLQAHTVSLSPDKQKKYLRAINTWNERHTHVLEDVQKLYGKLLHTASLIPAGRAYLTGFKRMLAVCEKKPFMPHRPDKSIGKDLQWWQETISSDAASCSIIPPPVHHNISAFSDASSGVRIGIIISKRWRAWQLLLQQLINVEGCMVSMGGISQIT